MSEASNNLSASVAGIPAVTTVGKRLAATMKYIRAIEHGAAGDVGVCHLLYPDLAKYVDNLYLVTGNLTTHLARVKGRCGGTFSGARTRAVG